MDFPPPLGAGTLPMVRRLACLKDSGSYTGGDLSPWQVYSSQTGLRGGIRRDPVPGPPGWGLGVGLPTPSRNNKPGTGTTTTITTTIRGSITDLSQTSGSMSTSAQRTEPCGGTSLL